MENTTQQKELPRASCLNKRGEWVPAIEEPYYLMFRKECRCGAKFWTMEGYEGHHALKHILAL